MSELELLQEELKGKIKAQDPNIKEIVEKIQQVQSSMEKFDVFAEVQSTAVIPSLEYYLTIVSDITKLIRNLVKQNKQIPTERVSQIMRECEKSGDLSQVAFEMFKRFVAYDQGPQVKQDALNFILEGLYQVMTKEETRALTFRIIESFLSQSQKTFSQRAVLESLSMLGIPEGELISFMIQRLNINNGKELPSSSPI